MSVCARCGAEFRCGMADGGGGGEPCWCTRMPVLPSSAYEVAAKCFCPDCLRAKVDGLVVEPEDGGD
ncbi:cysteine-rich CWC family protein [Noviherbaspirillum galbum]|uniref:Cysteine-rich CWC family protein n=1 Tax=Noviherbaspirillum galbum TaxID=2709383 RepID=A0A6B3SKP7_9BURK|nr:cysteine-rich CWC family protein [Noviherbaspirillum galbum]NEX61381.1 cysteine-rich CWC family protein [Noviherbaspirillum galbum]